MKHLLLSRLAFCVLMVSPPCTRVEIMASNTEGGECDSNSSTELLVSTETERTTSGAKEQEETTWQKFLKNMPKFSGYLHTGWNWSKTSADGSRAKSSFQAKRLRLIMDGNVGPMVDFRLQIEAFNGISGSTNGNKQKNVQVMDAFATVKFIPEFKVRVGQFYTPMGYENYDISPKTLETVDFSNIVYRMACRNPYEYNFVDYGRDLGVMFIGDIFDSGKGFRYLHYDVALTNGSLPSKDDGNSSKDFYLSTTIRPIKYFNIKGTFNWGRYTNENLAGGNGVGEDGTKYNPMTRFVLGAWYNNPAGLDLRAEYGMSKSKVGGTMQVDETGAYVFAGYHVGKWLPMVRWDMYKDDVSKTSGNNYNRILLGCNWNCLKNTTVKFNYHHYFYSDDFEKANGYKGNNQIQLMAQFSF